MENIPSFLNRNLDNRKNALRKGKFNMKNKILALLVTATMAMGLLAGCGDTKTNSVEKEALIETEIESEKEEPTETEEVIEETTEAATEEPTEEPTETVAQPTEAVEETPAFTYTDVSATKYAQQSVNVRSLPNTDGEQLGALSLNQEVTVTGQCNETSWYRIDFNGTVGYVSNNYLGDAKVEVQASQPAAQSAPAESAPAAETPAAPTTNDYPSVCSAGHETNAIYNGRVETDPSGMTGYCYEIYYNANLKAPSNMVWADCAAGSMARGQALAAGVDCEYSNIQRSKDAELPCGCSVWHMVAR